MSGKLECGLKYTTFKEFKILLNVETAGEWRIRSRSNGVIPKIADKEKVSEIKAYAQEQITNLVHKLKWDSLHGDMPASVKIEEWRTIPKHKPKWYLYAAEQGLLSPTSKPDCDNVITLYLDVISKEVIFDNKQIVELKYIKHYCDSRHPSPCLELTVRLYYQDFSEIKNAVSVHKEEII